MTDSEKTFKLVFKLYANINPDKKSLTIGRTETLVQAIIDDRSHVIVKEAVNIFDTNEELDPRIEYTLLVIMTDANEFIIYLFNLIKKLKSNMANEKTSAKYFSIVLPDFLIQRNFEPTYKSYEPEIELNAFSFGNIFEHRQFNEHRMQIEQHRRRKEFIQGGNLDGEFLRKCQLLNISASPMNAEFEHDRQILNINFFNLRKNEDTNRDTKGEMRRNEITKQRPSENEATKNDTVLDHVKLIVQYTSIKQIYWQVEAGRKGIRHKLYFRILYPPIIRRIKNIFLGANNSIRYPERCKSWDEMDKKIFDDVKDSPILMLDVDQNISTIKISEILARLQEMLMLPIEIRDFAIKTIPLKEQIGLWEDFYNDFDLIYSIEAFANSCGKIVVDQLADEEVCKQFFEEVLSAYREDRNLALESFDKLIQDLSDRKEIPIGGIVSFFQRVVQSFKNKVNDTYCDKKGWEKQGYVWIRRVTITPTRMIYGAREMIMGNRVLRYDPINYPPERFVRVVFREENFERVYSSRMTTQLIEDFVGNAMRQGIKLGDRIFLCLGSSNSQMRDGGCYFMRSKSLDEINKFRTSLGQFSTNSVPKFLSRLGQCFTQAQETTIDMTSQMLGWDFIGNSDGNEEPYIFSDGCGSMSLRAAKRIATELKLDSKNPPSCFQFRYAGYKGVLSINPEQDEAIKWFEQNHPVSTSRESVKAVDFYFRPSQLKFEMEGWKKARCKLEIVKYSSPVCVYMNRQLINILDQVSRKQSFKTYESVSRRIHFLLDKHLSDICSSLIDEESARAKLSEFPRLIEYKYLDAFNLVTEPFFRCLLRASARVSIYKLRQKMSIAIPSELGRIAFGVIDETGQLNYGQVFFQYTLGIHNEKQNVGTRILTGPVMITKNPCIVSGDVRMFEAIDIPALRHLVNVLVFPRSGHRPHSDEMAGSDLDGDEYVLIWDSELFFTKSEAAFDYTPVPGSLPEAVPDKPSDFQKMMATFMVNYLSHDSIGRIANSHLIVSDQYGIDSEVSQTIAKKHSQAVDFPKTGNPPKQLVKCWNGDTPPERFERAPDYMEKESHEPQYISNRLNGRLFRQIRKIADSIITCINFDTDEARDFDKLMVIHGCLDNYWCDREIETNYMQKASVLYQCYENTIKRILDFYGIQSEGELFASTYSVLRNRLSDRENDDMSFFNTTRIIEQQLKDAVKMSRHSFFNYFGGIFSATNKDGICVEPTEEMKLLASACYLYAYDPKCRRLLSFPWATCWDILNFIRRENIFKPGLSDGYRRGIMDPFGQKISKHMQDFLDVKIRDFDSFRNKLLTPRDNNMLALYTQKYPGLDQLMFFCVEWVRKSGLLQNGPFNEKHICMLVILFGIRAIPCDFVYGKYSQWLQPIHNGDQLTSMMVNISMHTGGLGRKFISLIHFLGSRAFSQLKELDFAQLGSQSYFFNGEWQEINKIALKTYHCLVFSDRFGFMLPTNGSKISDESSPAFLSKLIESPAFIFELPGCVRQIMNEKDTVKHITDALCIHTGCKAVNIRVDPGSKQNYRYNNSEIPKPIRMIISCWGSQEAIEKLRHLFAVCFQLDLQMNRRKRSQLIPMQIFERLRCLSPHLEKRMPSGNNTGNGNRPPFRFLQRN